MDATRGQFGHNFPAEPSDVFTRHLQSKWGKLCRTLCHTLCHRLGPHGVPPERRVLERASTSGCGNVRAVGVADVKSSGVVPVARSLPPGRAGHAYAMLCLSTRRLLCAVHPVALLA